jgi:hypothetical protein
MSRSWSAQARRVGVAGLAVSVLGVANVGEVSTSARGSSGEPYAQVARVLNVRDEGRLHYVKSSASVIIEEGRASGTFPGLVKVRFTYDGAPTVSARFTIAGSGGSISALGSARLSSPTSPSPSFHGTMQITGGSGRYTRVHGGGQLFGVYYRRSYRLTVQAIGKLPY